MASTMQAKGGTATSRSFKKTQGILLQLYRATAFSARLKATSFLLTNVLIALCAVQCASRERVQLHNSALGNTGIHQIKEKGHELFTLYRSCSSIAPNLCTNAFARVLEIILATLDCPHSVIISCTSFYCQRYFLNYNVLSYLCGFRTEIVILCVVTSTGAHFWQKGPQIGGLLILA